MTPEGRAELTRLGAEAEGRTRQSRLRMAWQSAELAQLAYHHVITGSPEAPAVCAWAVKARECRLEIEAATGAEADAYTAAMAQMLAPGLAASLAPATPVTVTGGVL